MVKKHTYVSEELITASIFRYIKAVPSRETSTNCYQNRLHHFPEYRSLGYVWIEGTQTNSRGRKQEEFLANRNLYLINEERERTTFLNNRGSSNIDLTIANNNLVADVNEWGVSNEESLSDHNYFQYKIRKRGTHSQNNHYPNQGTRFIIKEEKLQEFD
jgi:hypothetical protein